jgi:hypothetical protein
LSSDPFPYKIHKLVIIELVQYDFIDIFNISFCSFQVGLIAERRKMNKVT